MCVESVLHRGGEGTEEEDRAASPIVSIPRQQRQINADIQFAISFLFSPGILSMGLSHPHLGCI